MTVVAEQFEQSLQNADNYSEKKDYKLSYDLLTSLLEDDTKEPKKLSNIYWRLARESYEIGLIEGKNDKKIYNKWMKRGMEYADKAIEQDKTNWGANKWRAIFLDVIGRMQGIRQRIINSFYVKEHLLKASAIDPLDAETQHCLGVWCYELSELSFIEKKIASLIYATPPDTSYNEAIKYFMKAEELSPNFYVTNLMYIAKTHYRLKNYEECKNYCQQVLKFTGDDVDTKTALKDARDYLKYV